MLCPTILRSKDLKPDFHGFCTAFAEFTGINTGQNLAMYSSYILKRNDHLVHEMLLKKLGLCAQTQKIY